MTQQEVKNWRKVKKALEASGKTSSHIYARASEIVKKFDSAANWAAEKSS